MSQSEITGQVFSAGVQMPTNATNGYRMHCMLVFS